MAVLHRQIECQADPLEEDNKTDKRPPSLTLRGEGKAHLITGGFKEKWRYFNGLLERRHPSPSSMAG